MIISKLLTTPCSRKSGSQLGSGLRRIACLTALLFIFVSGVRAQYPITGTAFPDKNFYNVVLKNYSMYNGSVFVTNPGVTYMDVKSCNISDLTGIMYFPTLNTLDCSSNKLSSLILTGNTLLKTLDCSNNNLSSVNLSQNALLTTVTIYKNKLRGTYMDNFISNLFDLSGQPTKGELRIIYNENSSTGNKMTSAQVEAAKKKGWTPKMSTNGTTWTAYPGSDAIAINATNFPDENFREWLLEQSYGKDGYLSTPEIAAVTKIDVSNEGISSLKGIEYFTALTELKCYRNQLTTLVVSKNTALIYLGCGSNQLTSLDVSNNTALKELYCYYNQLTSLDVSNNTALTKLNCDDSQLASLNVSGCTALTDLQCGWNQLTSLDVSGCTALDALRCSENQLTELDVSGCTALTYLYCVGNQLTTLDVSSCTALTTLDCYVNQLTFLNVSGCTALTTLNFPGNQLTELDVSGCTALTEVYCYMNKIRGNGMTNLVKSLPDRNTASKEGKLMVYKDETPAGNLITPKQVEVATSKNWSVLRYDADNWEWVAYEGEPADGIEISEENFPDDAFRAYVGSAEIDTDEDGYLSDEEIEAVTEIDVMDMDIEDLTGIGYFTALKTLYADGNKLAELDLSKNTALDYLSCSDNQLTELDLGENTALTTLYCGGNQLTELDLRNNTKLESVNICNSQIYGEAMDRLIESLPTRTVGLGFRRFYAVDTNSETEGNIITKLQEHNLLAKRWSTLNALGNDYYPETIPGDFNGDGLVNTQDIDCLGNHILGINSGMYIFTEAELTDDDAVDIVDLTKLIKKLTE